MNKTKKDNVTDSGRGSYHKKLTWSNIVLLGTSIFLTFFILEIGARNWLRFFATPDQYKSYALITDISTENFRIMPLHYLNYRLTPNYRKGLAFHNSQGYRNNEFPPAKSGIPS